MTLNKQHCQPSSNRTPPLSPTEINRLMPELHYEWRLDGTSQAISRQFRFGNYYQTIAFVNAIAFISHQEDHHPDLKVSYNRCLVEFSTHAIGGLTMNDFICAARIDLLQDEP